MLFCFAIFCSSSFWEDVLFSFPLVYLFLSFFNVFFSYLKKRIEIACCLPNALIDANTRCKTEGGLAFLLPLAFEKITKSMHRYPLRFY